MQKKSFIKKATAFILAGIMAVSPAFPAVPVLADEAVPVAAETAELKVTTTDGGSVMVSADDAVLTVKSDEKGNCTVNGATEAVAAKVENGAAVVTARKGVTVTIKAVPESAYECAFFAVSTDTGDELNNAQAGTYVTVLDNNKKVAVRFTKVEVPVETAAVEAADDTEEPVAEEAAVEAEEAAVEAEEVPGEEAQEEAAAEEAPADDEEPAEEEVPSEDPAPEAEPVQEEGSEAEPAQEVVPEVTKAPEEAEEPSGEAQETETESITEDNTKDNTDGEAEPQEKDEAETSEAKESAEKDSEAEKEAPAETTAEDDRAAAETALRELFDMVAADRASYEAAHPSEIYMEAAAQASKTVTITKDILVADGFNSNRFSTAGSNKHNAFCLEPWKTAPLGSNKAIDARTAFSSYAYDRLAKLLYYAPEGPGYNANASYWNEIKSNYNSTPSYSNSLLEHEYAYIHLAASAVYANEMGQYAQWLNNLTANGINATKAKRAETLLANIAALNAPPSNFMLYKIDNTGTQDMIFWEISEVGSFQLTKKSSIKLSMTSLKGAVYTIYTDKALKHPYATVTTDDDGKATLKNVPVGAYYIKETKAPKNFDLDTKSYEFTIVAGKTTKVTSTEPEHSGSFELTKKSNITSTTSLKGAVYTVYTDEKLKHTYGTITTNDKGKATLENVPVGTYYIKETTAPKNFDLDKKVYTVKVVNGKTTKVTSTEPEKTGQFQIEKVVVNDTNKTISVEGAVYTMYTDEKCTKKFATLTIGKNNKSNIVKNIPYGTYYVKETKVPPYCMEDKTVHSVTINGNSEGEVDGIEFRTYKENAYGGIRIRKINAETGKTDPDLAGTQFDIYNKTGGTITVKNKTYKNDAKIMTVKINEDGIWESGDHDFPHGKYGIQEISTTSKYILSKEMMEVTVKEGMTFVEKKVENSPKRGDLSFHKKAAQSGISLPNVAFRIALLDDNNEEVEWHIIVTDEHGNASTKNEVHPHTKLTNENDKAYTKDANGKWVLDETKLSPDCGIWFYGNKDQVGKVDSKKGALPAGTYHITELKSSANANYKMLNDGKGIIVTIYDPIEKALGDFVNQEVWVPSIETVAANANASSPETTHIANAGAGTQLVDKVTYKEFQKAGDYRLVTKLFDGTTGKFVKDSSGKEYEQAQVFTVEEGQREGELTVPVNIDTTELVGHKLVFYEYVYDEEGKEVAKHEDPDDADQTIYFPHIGTKASDSETGSKFVDGTKPVAITDKVSYEGLQPGLAYTVNGTLMDKATGKALMDDAGKAITASKTFTPKNASGTVELEFRFNGKTLIGKTGVAFETVKFGDVEIAVHADINDKDQTVYFPSISTMLTVNGEKDAMASGTVTASDTISYNGLEPGSYVAVGTLMDQATGEAVTGEVEKAFTVEAPNGTVKVDFGLKADELAGKTVVAFEKVYMVEGEERTLVASHEDITDADQSIYFPQVGTELLDDTTKEHIALADEETVLVDHVSYSNVIVGKEYTASGVLVDKETREPVLVDGKQVTASKTFVPEENSGIIDIEFRFNSIALAGKTVVAFEDLLRDGRKVAVHADLTDADQTVYIPKVSTSLTGKKTGEHLANAEEKTVLEDAVAYENIIPGRTYVVKSTLMDKATGRTVSVTGAKAETVFTAKDVSATVTVSFELDTRSLAGKAVVCYEKLYIVDEGAEGNEELTDDVLSEVAAHEDLSDAEQTVYIPEIRTELVEKESGAHIALPLAEVTLVDTLSYKGLIPGKSYTAKGILMNKSTGDAQLVDGKEVTAEAAFTPEKAEGTVELAFTFNAQALAGQSVVAFERVYLGGVEVAVHADINDKDQTVEIPEVKIATVLTNDATGSHEALAADGLTFTDTVSYENVIAGAPLTLKGVLMDKETGEKLLIGGKEVTGEVTFTPASAKGSVKVPFALNGKGLEGKTIVAFERLYDKDGMVIALHEDINDPEQAVDLPETDTELKDSKTGEHETLATKNVTLTDLVTYKKLKPGKSYTAKGILMDKSTGKELLVDGKTVTAEAAFTPTEPNGTVELTFTFNGVPVAGKSVVAFEHIYDEKGVEVAVHADINDIDQTVGIPKIVTELVDTVTGTHEAKAAETMTLVDKVSYTNVKPGKPYTAKGILMDKSTGKELLVDGKTVTAEAAFTPEKADGVVELTFTFKGLSLAGKKVVAFEDLYDEKGIKVAVHADINDKDQTVDIPEIKTELKNTVTDTHEAKADETITLVDKVTYRNVQPGKSYSVKGVMMDKATGKELLVDGKTVTAEAAFTPEKADGVVELTFTFKGLSLAGRSVVAFETMYNEKGLEVAVHADIEDKDQTVDIPEADTELKDSKTGEHETLATEKVTLTDRVTFKKLQPGKPYSVKGILMDKATEKPLLVNGKEVTAEAAFTPEKPDGSVELTFTFNGIPVAGKSVVAFESVYDEKGNEVAVHADIEDDDQTVNIPKIRTELKNTATGSHEAKADETMVLVDKVSYTNVQPGKPYIVKGTLMDKATGKEFLVDGKAVTAEAAFTPEKADGEVELTFTFKGMDLKGKSIVAFEHLFNEKGTEVAVHADIEDKDQTVDIPEIDTELKDSETGEHETLAREKVVLVDVVTFKNLKPGKNYKTTGTLMDKATEEPLLVDGKEVTAEAEFTPDEPDGTVELTFTFNGIPVAGKSVVAFERVYDEKGIEVAVHTDINDKDQTVDIPKIETELKDTVTGTHEAKADETMVLVDKVTFTNVKPGQPYVVKGTLMEKATGKELLIDGKTVTSEAEFTPEEANGIVELTFTFKGLDLAGKSVVAFEHLYNEKGIEVAVHADIEDKDQTVDIPEIDTELKDSVTETHDALATENVVLIDQVTFKNMKPGKTYKAKGILMDKSTGEPLLVDGKEVTAEAEFKPEKADGVVDLTFTFNGIPVAGKSVVAFERVYNEGGIEVAVHTDLEDDDQTVNIPEVKTELKNDKTGTHEAKAEEHMSLTDIVSFKGLTIGKKYVVNGILMDKSTGEPILVDGKEITAKTEFTPDKAEGSAELTFTFNGLKLAGKSVVAFETVYNEAGKEVAVHADIEDKDQTVNIPKADTELTDKETGTHVTYAKKTVTLVDDVTFTNLIPNKKYVFKGVLMDKATGKELLVDGKTVTDEQEYTPQAPNGVVKLTFTFNGVPVAGRHVVAFERIYDEGGNEVAVHTDINDTDQTVDIPKISTVLTDKKSGTHTAKADEKITVIDKVTYEALPAGEYVMSGVLMDKKTGKPLMVDGKQVTATKKFTADGKDGSVELAFTFKGVDMAGKAVVAFETLYDAKGEVVADHKDITDPDQTVFIPKLTTDLKDKVTKTHTAEALKSVTLVDEVKYSGLTPNKKYVLKGVLMDKETGKPLVVEGKQVTAEQSFIPKKSSGTEYISFTFNGIPVAGKHVVAFEYAYDEKGNEVAVHTDINDDDQTVNIPKIVTELVNKATKAHTVNAAASVTLTDKVTYTALTPGESCTVKGILMDKSTGKPLMVNGKQVTAVKTFIVDKSGNGSVELDFTLSTSALGGKSLVAFEYVSNKDGKQIASHTDINDVAQTVKVPGNPPHDTPKTGDTAKGAIAFIVMMLGVAAVVIGMKRRKDTVK